MNIRWRYKLRFYDMNSEYKFRRSLSGLCSNRKKSLKHRLYFRDKSSFSFYKRMKSYCENETFSQMKLNRIIVCITTHQNCNKNIPTLSSIKNEAHRNYIVYRFYKTGYIETMI